MSWEQLRATLEPHEFYPCLNFTDLAAAWRWRAKRINGLIKYQFLYRSSICIKHERGQVMVAMHLCSFVDRCTVIMNAGERFLALVVWRSIRTLIKYYEHVPAARTLSIFNNSLRHILVHTAALPKGSADVNISFERLRICTRMTSTVDKHYPSLSTITNMNLF